MTQTAMFDYSGKPVVQQTREAALRSLTPQALRDQHRAIIQALSWQPLTDEEIQEVAQLSPNAERPRRGELVEMGIVRESGTTRATKSGRQACVWELVRP